MIKKSDIKEFYQFMKERKLLWLTPIFVILLLLSIFLLVVGESVLAPFIYTLF